MRDALFEQPTKYCVTNFEEGEIVRINKKIQRKLSVGLILFLVFLNIIAFIGMQGQASLPGCLLKRVFQIFVCVKVFDHNYTMCYMEYLN